MWAAAQSSQAGKPLKVSRPKSATAALRPTVARLPAWREREGPGGGPPAPRRPVDHDLAPRLVDAGDAAELDARVRLSGQDGADRPGDVGRREGGGRYLVEQGLEQVVVAPVDQDDVDRGAGERPGAGEAAEASPEDDD